jgi:hypothetical protein
MLQVARNDNLLHPADLYFPPGKKIRAVPERERRGA